MSELCVKNTLVVYYNQEGKEKIVLSQPTEPILWTIIASKSTQQMLKLGAKYKVGPSKETDWQLAAFVPDGFLLFTKSTAKASNVPISSCLQKTFFANSTKNDIDATLLGKSLNGRWLQTPALLCIQSQPIWEQYLQPYHLPNTINNIFGTIGKQVTIAQRQISNAITLTYYPKRLLKEITPTTKQKSSKPKMSTNKKSKSKASPTTTTAVTTTPTLVQEYEEEEEEEDMTGEEDEIDEESTEDEPNINLTEESVLPEGLEELHGGEEEAEAEDEEEMEDDLNEE